MKVFISWSGNDSRQVAQLLSNWIPNVLQGVETWVSYADIEKGKLWMTDIGDALKGTFFGILCLTRSNIDAPWILFEAGALSKGLTKSRVCPVLIGLTCKELKLPLSNFNATMPDRDDMLILIKTINAQVGEKKLSEKRVEEAFDKWWNDFKNEFDKIVNGFKSSKAVPYRSVDEMVVEILELARSIQANVQQERGSFSPNPSRTWNGFSPQFYTGLPKIDPWSPFQSQTPSAE
jgi:hypothetical protein